ncbi:ABC transporter permease [Candidatus Tenderia electrophaga]|jgi:putative ABC transport system permease protein|uniref:ABC transporter permease n=1 Tax=Candidatus Tenderia electrophaga TaxID=1748243 RepID=A0A0S2TE69_9GAMM|nr:ABC transporter permease [Candidatus Tenderia electrophaga]
MNAFRLGLRQLRRDWRAGELTILALALVIAVASVSSVNFFTSRIHQALELQANDLLGGDLVLVSRDPIAAQRRDHARDAGLRSAATVEFPTMVLAGEQSQLVGLKAVSANYPLRGRNRIAPEQFAPDEAVAHGPEPGTAWADGRLMNALKLEVGETVQVGETTLRIGAVLTSEPTQSGGMISGFVPRLLMNLEDLPATELVQPASRVRYRLLVAGAPEQVEQLRRQWQDTLAPGEELNSVKDARPQVRTALERGERFLGLAALVSVLLAGAAVAMAARRYVSRHLDNCAVMRCLGASQAVINRLYLYQMLVLGLLASALGVALGYLAQGGLVLFLGELARIQLPAPSAWPVALGMLTGMITLLGFAMPPILQLANVSTMRVIRRDLGRLQINSLLAYSAGSAAFVVLALLQAQDTRLALTILAGLVVLLLALAALVGVLLLILKPLSRQGRASWRFGLVNISRRAGSSMLQMMGFSIGLMALLLLTVVRTDLLEEWQGKVPADAPNRFLINVQPEQLDQVEGFFARQGIEVPELYPMVRMRLVEINGQAVSEDDFATERGKRLATREFNLSWAADLQADNNIVAGRWWDEDEHGRPMLSVEQGIAEELDLQLGDTLTYRAAGQQFTAPITSLRTVEWDSFRANFFVLAPPGVLEGFPVSYMSAFYLPADEHQVLNDLVQQFPNITVFDVDAIMGQVRRIIARVTLAVEYVFVFTLLAGLMVMYAAIHSSRDERIHEAAVLRTLGARRSQLLGSLMLEYAGLGLMSGLVAALSAGGVGMVVAERIFELEYAPGPTLWFGGMLIGALGIGIAGTLGTRFVINQPPLRTLRSV